jgi:hypothetical protein
MLEYLPKLLDSLHILKDGVSIAFGMGAVGRRGPIRDDRLKSGIEPGHLMV